MSLLRCGVRRRYLLRNFLKGSGLIHSRYGGFTSTSFHKIMNNFHGRTIYSAFTNFAESFFTNIFVTVCHSHMGFLPLDLESKLWGLFFLHLMTFSVTLTFDFAHSIEMQGYLDQVSYIFLTIVMKSSFPITHET